VAAAARQAVAAREVQVIDAAADLGLNGGAMVTAVVRDGKPLPTNQAL
jgi:hypothetical protein